MIWFWVYFTLGLVVVLVLWKVCDYEDSGHRSKKRKTSRAKKLQSDTLRWGVNVYSGYCFKAYLCFKGDKSTIHLIQVIVAPIVVQRAGVVIIANNYLRSHAI